MSTRKLYTQDCVLSVDFMHQEKFLVFLFFSLEETDDDGAAAAATAAVTGTATASIGAAGAREGSGSPAAADCKPATADQHHPDANGRADLSERK